MKPTKEQIKIALKKILIWQREQKNKEENTVSTKDDIENKATLNDIPVVDNVQGENENKIIREAEKNPKFKESILKSQERKKHSETPTFHNEQMLLHFYDMRETIKLRFSEELISVEEDLDIVFQNQVIPIEPCIVISAFAYEELNKTYKIESKAFVQVIFSKFGDEYPHIDATLIIDFLNEIIKEKKLQIEKEAFKRKVVWLKK